MPSNNKHALIIGVGDDLPITIKDAQSMYDVLIDPAIGGYEPGNVTLLNAQDFDKFPKRTAGKLTIINALKELISKTKDDPAATVFIYYSGHGGLVKKQDESTAYYMFTYGYDEYNPEHTMLHGNTFSWMINNIQCNKLMVLLDCCHADGMENEGKVFTRRVPAVNEAGIAPRSELLKKMTVGEGRVFISSCKDDQKSIIARNAENSLFTEVILNTLHGKYNMPEESHVRAVDLVHSLLTKVPGKAMQYKKEQVPVLSGADDLDHAFLLCRNSRYNIHHGEEDPLDPVEHITFAEKKEAVKQYEYKLDPDEIISDLTELINEDVPDDLIKDVEKLLDDHKGFLNKVRDVFSGWFR